MAEKNCKCIAMPICCKINQGRKGKREILSNSIPQLKEILLCFQVGLKEQISPIMSWCNIRLSMTGIPNQHIQILELGHLITISNIWWANLELLNQALKLVHNTPLVNLLPIELLMLPMKQRDLREEIQIRRGIGKFQRNRIS